MIELQKQVPENVQIDLKMIKFGIERTLETLNSPEVDITLRITNDAEILQLNQVYRGIAKATDVLSFNQDTVDPQTLRLYLGDIIISYERVRQQAHQNAHTFNEECTLLAIHGTLHLLGYDHYEEDEKERMWDLQERILNDTINFYQGGTK
jgi:probable rRNA maturation factor